MSNDQIAAIEKAYLETNTNSDLSHKERVRELFKIFQLIVELSTAPESISFTTLFSRLAYIGTRDEVPRRVLYRCHFFRRQCELDLVNEEQVEAIEQLGRYAVESLLHHLFGTAHDPRGLEKTFEHLLQRGSKAVDVRPVVKALIISVNLEDYSLVFIDEATGDEELTAQFDIADRNEIFTSNIRSAGKYFDLPIQANFLDVKITSEGVYEPAGIVLTPDYLVDVTAVAECFSSDGAQPMAYLLRKFMPRTISTPLMIGNIVNQLLDELISDPGITFDQVRHKIFRIAPLQFALCSDREVREILQKCYSHFLHMKKVVNDDFKERQIFIGNVYLEPSFYSQQYGIQGRLDLLHVDHKRRQIDIVELKSGKPFRPNKYGLSSNHYTQTLLYDMIMHSVYQDRFDITPYILYSVLENEQLRFAPPVKAQQYESVKVRNDIISLEHQLATLTSGEGNILEFLNPIHLPAKGFVARNVEEFDKIYQGLLSEEKAYFDHFVAFIAREHRLAKTGEHGLSKSNGLSALWLDNREEKEDRFAILANLEVLENHSKADPPRLVLKRTSDTHPLANFRAGDIAVLYPAAGQLHEVLHNQILKCSILQVTDTKIEVRLRSKQYNQGIFRRNQHWHVEDDILDSSFNAMYRSLFAWAGSRSDYKSRFLGRQAPSSPNAVEDLPLYPALTDEQQSILHKMIEAQDYYLLWGPPGTGKTSKMLHHYVDYLYRNTTETVLVMAYTNRAVDEICDAICSADPDMKEQFIRLGSSMGCGPDYRSRLLRSLVDQQDSRSQILDLLNGSRLFVSTVSSILSNVELLHLVNFDTVIIDEASQILEPMLSGLLHRFGKWVMIGDHKQLPAVVRQHATDTTVQDDGLVRLGVTDCRMSLFERLYLRARDQGWEHAIGILGAQGRMHEEVMAFPNQHFYDGRLRTIDAVARLQASISPIDSLPLHQILSQQRNLFIPCRTDGHYNWKVNRHEARVVTRVVQYLTTWHSKRGVPINNKTIGVITPYRAQIAQIKDALLKDGCQEPITVDTVERYQGGARDIIIISLCTNRLSQLDALISRSTEGVDRKLNVALTRAREQVIIIGNEEILRYDETYSALIEHAFHWKVDG